jgi:hypothetical protein
MISKMIFAAKWAADYFVFICGLMTVTAGFVGGMMLLSEGLYWIST